MTIKITFVERDADAETKWTRAKRQRDGTRATRRLTEAVKKEKSPLGFDHLWFFFFLCRPLNMQHLHFITFKV